MDILTIIDLWLSKTQQLSKIMNTQSSSNLASLANYAVLSACVAIAAFVTGYSAIRVGLTDTTLMADAQTQVNTVPHQGTLWADFAE